MAQRPDDQPDSIVFSQFDGLRNTVGPTRLGPSDLARAVNIDLDDAKQARRRRGYTKVTSGNFHSLKTVEGRTFAVRDGTLVEVLPGYAFKNILPGVGPRRVTYVDVAGTVYFSSVVTSGKVLPDGSVDGWGAGPAEAEWHSPVVNPTPTLPDLNGKLLGPPPLAGHMALYNGRIYLARGNVLWATELYQFDYVDRTRNFMQFESDITGVAAVADGIYVGTRTAVWFLQGAFGSMQRTKMTPEGMVEHTVVEVPMEALALESPGFGHAIMFTSPSGICVGLMSGVCYSLTRSKFALPAADKGAAMYRYEDGTNQYVGALDSAGSPTSAARFGDYVDAEIRRFEGA